MFLFTSGYSFDYESWIFNREVVMEQI